MHTELQVAAQSQRAYVYVVAPMMGKPYGGALTILFVSDTEAELVDLGFCHWDLVLQRWKNASRDRNRVSEAKLDSRCFHRGSC
jgi:hypothetical protein